MSSSFVRSYPKNASSMRHIEYKTKRKLMVRTMVKSTRNAVVPPLPRACSVKQNVASRYQQIDVDTAISAARSPRPRVSETPEVSCGALSRLRRSGKKRPAAPGWLAMSEGLMMTSARLHLYVPSALTCAPSVVQAAGLRGDDLVAQHHLAVGLARGALRERP